jgi:archaellum component FlaG (FlaF/FlaG flagellin family)
MRFTNTHFSEAALSLPEPNTEYQLIKNIGALSITPSSRRFWVLVNGKLEGSKLSSGVVVGSFIKQ